VVEGPEAVEFLHGLVSQDVKGLGEGCACYATFLTAKGRMLADARIFRLDGRLVLDLEPGLAPAILEHLERYVIAAKVELRDATEELGLITVQGREAPRVVGDFLGEPIEPLAPLETLGCSFDDRPLTLIGTASTGEVGYDLLAPRAVMASLWEAIIEAGAGIRPVGAQALEILRVEAGIPRFGAELDGDTLPLEAGLDHAISYTKGCYLGQEIIARVTHQGHVNRRLTGFLLEQGRLPERGAALSDGEREAGRLTSIVTSPYLGRPIALGYVRNDSAEPGTELTLAGGGKAVVHALPFYRRP
jgi:folate-binding protein YgfZ